MKADRVREQLQSTLSPEIFSTICQIVYDDFALNLDDTKKSMVYRRLSPRLKALGVTDFRDYADLLQTDTAERRGLMSLLTTNLTSFFRERHHFEFLEADWLPELIKRARSGGRVRLWSAACSTGQEPYSMAMSILEACPEAASLNIKILGTDVDSSVVKIAKKGTYDEDKVDGIPPALRAKYFTRSNDCLQASDSLRSLISFGQLNLIGDWPFSGVFDVIFCRNVAIYFDAKTQERLWEKLTGQMPKGSLLCIGHSERIAGAAADTVKSLGKTAYERR